MPILIAEVGLMHYGCEAVLNAILERVPRRTGGCWLKLQCHTGQTVAPGPHPLYPSVDRAAWYAQTDLADASLARIVACARHYAIPIGWSCFSAEAVARVARWQPDFWKIPSGEVTTLELRRAVRAAANGRPILVSNGLGGDLDIASDATGEIAMLCTSSYPCNPDHVGLSVPMPRGPWGISDHTSDGIAGIAASVLGASYVERHICLARGMPGPDSSVAMPVSTVAKYMATLDRAARCVVPEGRAEWLRSAEAAGMRKAFVP